MLWAAVRNGVALAGRHLVGLILTGWGAFNLVEGIVDHQILTVHHVNPDNVGRGLRRAVGELVICPYCLGLWIAAAFAAGLVIAPRPTRWAAGVLAAAFGSDVLQIAYKKAEDTL